MKMDQRSLLLFAKTLAGQYSNKQQTQEDPVHFAHINIFFRPLPWEVFQGPGYYSEQSYDYDQWSPYRQGVHRLSQGKSFFLIENYGLPEPLRVAGAGLHPELLNKLNITELLPRCGCNMHFSEIKPGHYMGKVKPGNACIVPREGKLTYLVSEVEVDEHNWISRDRGFDPNTHEQLWGSEYGPLRFQRVKNLGDHLEEDWLQTSSI